jgi:hypothetical protein
MRAFPAHEIDEESWDEAVAVLPAGYQRACHLARQAESELDAEAVNDLTFDLLGVQDPAELEAFLGKLTRGVGRAARDVGKGVSRIAAAAAPAVSTVTKLASRATPLGALARATYGAVSAAVSGKNILTGALDGLGGTPAFAALIRVGLAVVRGDNLIAAAKMAIKAGIADVRDAVRLAAMVAPFVPGIGTGIGAALGAADALANGQPITNALIAGIRGAIPGGAAAQLAFDAAAQLAQGKRIDQALLTAARNRLPAGAAQAAFDTGLAIAQGKKLQDALLAGGGRLLPPSPYAADLQSFARRAVAGDNLGRAALSSAGNAVMRRVRQQGGDLVAAVQGRAPAPRPPETLDRMISASNLSERRDADRFLTGFGAGRS